LIVLCFVSVLALSSQSAASYPTYLLALSMLVSVRSWNDVFRTRLAWMIVVLVGFLTVSSFWSDPFSWRGILGISVRAILVFTFVVALAECQLRGQVQIWLGRALAIVGMGSATAAIVYFSMDPPAGARLSGLGQLDNPVVVGLVFSAVLILLVDIVLADSRPYWRVIAGVGSVVAAYAVVLSGSRNAWMSSLIGILVFVVSTRVRDPQRFVAASASVGVILVAVVSTMAVGESTSQILLPRGDSFRLEIWADVFARVWAEGPIFGLGILTPDGVKLGDVSFQHPHNMYLAVFFQGGLLAVVMFLGVIGACVFTLLEEYHRRSAKLALGLLALALTSYVLDGHELVDKVGETWFLFWLPVGIALGLRWSATVTAADVDGV
jgi:O-antigen ligase